jgi:hypothetical protein
MKQLEFKKYFILRVDFTKVEFNPEKIESVRRFMFDIDVYNKFYHDFFEKVSGLEWNAFHEKYRSFTTECAMETLLDSGIMMCEGNKHRVFMIPNHHQDIIDWVNKNLTLPHKQLKRCRKIYPFHYYETPRYFRDKHYEK